MRPPQNRDSYGAYATHSESPEANPQASGYRERRGSALSPAPGRRDRAGRAGALRWVRSPAQSARRCALRGGRPILFRAVRRFVLDAKTDSTSSLRAAFRHFENESNRFGQSPPAGSFCFELRSPFSRQAIKFGLTPGLGLVPFGRENATIF